MHARGQALWESHNAAANRTMRFFSLRALTSSPSEQREKCVVSFSSYIGSFIRHKIFLHRVLLKLTHTAQHDTKHVPQDHRPQAFERITPSRLSSRLRLRHECQNRSCPKCAGASAPCANHLCKSSRSRTRRSPGLFDQVSYAAGRVLHIPLAARYPPRI
jgi:hypothetical protein